MNNGMEALLPCMKCGYFPDIQASSQLPTSGKYYLSTNCPDCDNEHITWLDEFEEFYLKELIEKWNAAMKDERTIAVPLLQLKKIYHLRAQHLPDLDKFLDKFLEKYLGESE